MAEPRPMTEIQARAVSDQVNAALAELEEIARQTSHSGLWRDVADTWEEWVDQTLDQVPKDAAARKEWLRKQRFIDRADGWRDALRKWYGPQADKVRFAEAFEITEYGRRPSEDEIRKLLPFFPARP